MVQALRQNCQEVTERAFGLENKCRSAVLDRGPTTSLTSVNDSDSSTDIEPVEETNCNTVMPSTSTKKNARSRPKNPKAKSKRATKIKRNRSEEQLISDSDSDSDSGK